MAIWHGVGTHRAKKFVCGYCGQTVASEKGWITEGNAPHSYVYVCPHCTAPTFFAPNGQVPGVVPGEEVGHLPEHVKALYREARQCVAVNSCTASVLASRKLLMHIAVAQGAKAGETFMAYVEYLAANGFVPPNGKGWVDHIRKKGNEANHEISLMTPADADELIAFSEMLLKFIYEFPNRVPKGGP
ncbi:MAG: DUF4145 domain-containing protein [Betaproteobacteria bacterium]